MHGFAETIKAKEATGKEPVDQSLEHTKGWEQFIFLLARAERFLNTSGTVESLQKSIASIVGSN